MDALTALKTRRSIRRFTQEPIPAETLDAILECARFYPTAANLQPLKFGLAAGERAKQVLPYLRWAAYLPGYRMTEDEQPTAVILILGDRQICKEFDFSAGAAANQILLSAHALGVASCCLGLDEKRRGAIAQTLGLDTDRFSLLYAIALGNAEQTSQAVDMTDGCKYSLDDGQNFRVPKRTAEEIVLRF